jgi:hypothetical protein
MPPEECIFGKRAIAQRLVGPRAFVKSGLRKVEAASTIVALWVILEFKTGNVPALVDTTTQLSCVRSDVNEFLKIRDNVVPFLRVLCLAFWRTGNVAKYQMPLKSI